MDINGTKSTLSPQLPKPELEVASNPNPVAPNTIESNNHDVKSNTVPRDKGTVTISHMGNTLQSLTAELQSSETPIDESRVARAKQAIADGTLTMLSAPEEGARNIVAKLMEETQGNED